MNIIGSKVSIEGHAGIEEGEVVSVGYRSDANQFMLLVAIKDGTLEEWPADRVTVVGRATVDENTSDGYHTFKELYDHRHALFIRLARFVAADDQRRYPSVWRSRLHSDGTAFDGWFILGIGANPGEQMTYHLPLSLWGETEFAETRPRAPEFDGHTSAEVLQRIRRL